MSKNPEIIDFNTVVDKVLQRQLDQAIGRWPGMRSSAKFGEVAYAKVKRGDVRNTVIGRNVGDLTMRAITIPITPTYALDERSERIYHGAWLSFRTHGKQQMDRHIYIGGNHIGLGHAFTKEITDSDERTAVVDFARSPQLETGILAVMSELNPDDIRDLFTRLDSDKERAEAFRAELRAIDDATRLPGLYG